MKPARFLSVFSTLLVCTSGMAPAADPQPPKVETITHRITGLCCPERVPDLQEALKDQAEVKLEKIDYDHAEATFTYAPKVFSAERLRQVLGSKGFGMKPPATVPADQWTRLEIPIFGLDCKACSLGAYNAVIKVDGVEQAYASFKEGHITALFDPAKTNREAIEEALKKARIPLKPAGQQ